MQIENAWSGSVTVPQWVPRSESELRAGRQLLIALERVLRCDVLGTPRAAAMRMEELGLACTRIIGRPLPIGTHERPGVGFLARRVAWECAEMCAYWAGRAVDTDAAVWDLGIDQIEVGEATALIRQQLAEPGEKLLVTS